MIEAYGAATTAGAGIVYALHSDRQGSVIAVTEQATGTVAARYEYDAFGQRSVVTGAGLQDYGFTGREYDSETGLYYYRARHYDPAPGRFLQSDPLGFAAGNLNLYAYTWNDPANWTDPSGLSPEGDVTYEAALVMMYQHEAVAVVGTGAVCAANRISTALYDMGNLLAEGRPVYEAELEPAASCATQAVATAVASRFAAPRLTPCGVRFGIGRGGKNSFPAGTEVLTPDGPVAIETLREGDLMVARDEETGESGVFPVTGVAAPRRITVSPDNISIGAVVAS